MARLGMIELDQLPPMQVLEDLDSEALVTARMTKFVEIWNQYDPPVAASYDVESLEFDPIKIVEELSAYFELLLRDRINQACKAVTLAFGTDGDLEAIASRYPGGIPRQAIVDSPRGTSIEHPEDYEDDDAYRTRIWLSPNTLSPHGSYEAYVFWALTALPELRDATAYAKRGTPNVTITIMADGDEMEVGDNGLSATAFPSPTPSADDIDTVLEYVTSDARKALTDVVNVRAPKIVHTDYDIDIWLFPGWDKSSLMKEIWKAVVALIEEQRWLGYSHTIASIEAACMIPGVYNCKVKTPAADVVLEIHEVVVVDNIAIAYKGRGGFEQAEEP